MFTKLIKSALAALLFAALTLAPSFALVTDPNRIVPERTCDFSQAICYSRVTINFNDPRISAGVWYLTLPKNAYILQIDAQVITAFNAGTTNVLTIGATQASANEILASGITAGSTGIYHLTSAAGLGNVITNNATYQTALNGAVPVWAKYAQTGTAATTGQVIIIITFVKNNDQ
jgi:hypothetical protein